MCDDFSGEISQHTDKEKQTSYKVLRHRLEDLMFHIRHLQQ
jgi:hypothetical protein